jgi:hypothetical protein
MLSTALEEAGGAVGAAAAGADAEATGGGGDTAVEASLLPIGTAPDVTRAVVGATSRASSQKPGWPRCATRERKGVERTRRATSASFAVVGVASAAVGVCSAVMGVWSGEMM